MKVLITIPAYNEEGSIGKVLQELQEISKKCEAKVEVLVVDDGSSDNTATIAKEAGAIVISHKQNRGLIEAFRTEMKQCLTRKPDVIIHIDADGQYPASFIPEMIKEIQNGADVVLGSRFGPGHYAGPLMNRIGNVAFAKVVSNLIGLKITDTTTGFRAFTLDVAKIPLINSFTYTQEQIIKAAKLGFKIKEIPITTRVTRRSKLFCNPFQYALKAWINIMRIYRDYNPLSFFGRIGVVFLLVGLALGLWVFYSILTTGGVGGIPRVILSAVLLLTGIQIILFGFLADMLRREG